MARYLHVALHLLLLWQILLFAENRSHHKRLKQYLICFETNIKISNKFKASKYGPLKQTFLPTTIESAIVNFSLWTTIRSSSITLLSFEVLIKNCLDVFYSTLSILLVNILFVSYASQWAYADRPWILKYMSTVSWCFLLLCAVFLLLFLFSNLCSRLHFAYFSEMLISFFFYIKTQLVCLSIDFLKVSRNWTWHFLIFS